MLIFVNFSDVKKRPLKWVVDITIGYPEGDALGLTTVVGGWRKPCCTTLYYRKYPIDQVPLDTEELTKWLYQRFVEKEALLEEFYKTGKFPPPPADKVRYTEGARTENGPTNLVKMDNIFMAVLHLFFMTLTWMEYRIISQIWGLVKTLATCLHTLGIFM